MSWDESDAMYEEGMSALYEDFKYQFTNDFIINGIDKFYNDNRDIVKPPIENLNKSRALYNNEFITPAFLHAIISIEVGIKLVALKPILYSLAINYDAGDILYENTFKQKSLQNIPSFYYDIFEKITGLDFKSIRATHSHITVWNEWGELQKIRNSVVHQGFFVEKKYSERAINMATYICEEIIPSILDIFLLHTENGIIEKGSREYIIRRKQLGYSQSIDT